MKKLKVRVCGWRELNEQQISAWDALEGRALNQNIYLSPHFVLPALKYLEHSDDVIAICIEEQDSIGNKLFGFGLFEPVSGTRRFPLAHLRALRTRHSYETGLLLDPEHAEKVVDTFLRWCFSPSFPWHGIEFSLWPSGSACDALLQDGCRTYRAPWIELRRTQRAILYPAQAGEDYIQNYLSANRRKDLRRKGRRLSELGTVTWTAYTGSNVDGNCVQRFLDLEHAGWKGEQQTALKSHAGNEQFFREMVRGFSDAGRAVFTELRVANCVISSTSNIIAGHAGFAFKLGWHPDYARMSPSILNELEIIRNSPQLFSTLDYLDSGANEGSFMDKLWVHRRTLAHVVIPTSLPGRLILNAYSMARNIKRQLY